MERLDEIAAQLKLFDGRSALSLQEFVTLSGLADEALAIRLFNVEKRLYKLENKLNEENTKKSSS